MCECCVLALSPLRTRGKKQPNGKCQLINPVSHLGRHNHIIATGQGSLTSLFGPVDEYPGRRGPGQVQTRDRHFDHGRSELVGCLQTSRRLRVRRFRRLSRFRRHDRSRGWETELHGGVLQRTLRRPGQTRRSSLLGPQSRLPLRWPRSRTRGQDRQQLRCDGELRGLVRGNQHRCSLWSGS